jgi:competence protein ComFC
MEKSIWSSVIDFVFPPSCAVCNSIIDKDEQFDTVCHTCFLRVPEKIHVEHKLKPFDRVVFYTSYADPTARMLVDYFKYRGVTSLAAPLAELQARALEELGVERLFYGQKPVFTYIPLHPLKERLRGYNQSGLLASYLGDYFSLPVLPLLRRSWIAPAQASLQDESQRKENIKGAFARITSKVPEKIILIDDVYTSGATLKEAGKLLKRAGAKTLWAVTVAGRVKP